MYVQKHTKSEKTNIDLLFALVFITLGMFLLGAGQNLNGLM